MPVDKSRYPDDWDEISKRIRFERAGNRCEWCRVPNHTTIVRSVEDGAKYVIYDEDEGVFTWPDGTWIRMSELPAEYAEKEKWTRVILTVAHLGTDHPDGRLGDKHDKLDVREENLAALCQRCHLMYDLDDHIANRKRTMAERKRQQQLDAGQLGLWDHD